ncbi:DNA-binding transcriptional LysR family regulator [Paraburkholderia sp. GAS38]|uniref:LysR family transcriptional regulator n=1 Tax=Paraburkholderia sp. GAS38 TaxID=3035133 RepID=UPI003D195960
MVELDDMRLFRALGVSPSLAAAARRLNLTPPAVTIRLQRLEERLGVRLAIREARGFSLTDEGRRFLDEAKELLERIEAIPASVSGKTDHVSGNLRVVAPLGFGRAYVSSIVGDLRQSHPRLAISLHLSESPLTAAAGADVVVSIGNLRASSWIGHFLAPNDRLLCASPAFAHRLRQVKHPSELAQFECLCLRENDEDLPRWRFTPRDGGAKHAQKPVTVRISGALSTNDGTVIRDWAIDGLGIAERSEWDVSHLIAEGKLVRVLPTWSLAPAPVMALLPTRQGVSVRQRVFLEAAKRALNPAPWRA